MSRVPYIVATILVLVGVPGSLSAARAETIVLKAELTGTNEVPPNNSPASGQAMASFDTATKTLTWTITYKDLTGPATAGLAGTESEATPPRAQLL